MALFWPADTDAVVFATGERLLIEDSAYNFFCGSGYDSRKENQYGNVIMRLANKLQSAQDEA